MGTLEKKLIDCIDLEKLSVILVEDVVLASIKKVCDDSANTIDNAIYEMLAPLVKSQAEKALLDLIAKLKA